MNSTVTKNKKFFYSLLCYFAASLIIFVFILFQIPGPLSSFVEEDLGGHMVVEHSIFFLFGYFIVFSIERLISKKSLFGSKIFSNLCSITLLQYEKFKANRHFKNNRYIMVFAIISLLFFWHIPIIFDFAFYDNTVHLFQHLSFIVVGMCIYTVIKKFDFTFLFLSLVLIGGVMGLYGLLLILSNMPIYSYYSIQSHINAGNYMIISSIVMMIVILPIILIKKAIVHLNDDSSYQ